MTVTVVLRSPEGTERRVIVTERSSDEATMAAAVRCAQRSWDDRCEGWLPVRVDPYA